jgi:hypothetical protein
VAHVDDVDALGAAAVVDREQMAAGQREQLAHTVGLQAPRHQPAAVQRARLLRFDRHGAAIYPPAGGLDAGKGVLARRARVRFGCMENEPKIRDADLELLLAESDREEPFLVFPRRPEAVQEPREEIDEQILAGLVTPY